MASRSNTDTGGGQNPPTHNQETELTNINENRIDGNKQLHVSLKRIQDVNQPGTRDLVDNNSGRKRKKTLFALQNEYSDSCRELESELGQFMTNNFAQYLFSEEMMSNEIAQQIRACLATVQHAQNRLQTSSDALISMMRQKAKIADSLELEEQTQQLISDAVKSQKNSQFEFRLTM